MRSHADVREFLEHAWAAILDLEFEILEGPFLAPDGPSLTFRWRGTGTFTAHGPPGSPRRTSGSTSPASTCTSTATAG